MTPGERKTYDAYWQACEMLEDADVPVTGIVEEMVRYTSQEIGELFDAFIALTGEE